jgi:tRNA pseudouridine55 synthase
MTEWAVFLMMRAMDGLLLLDKPAGITSFGVVARVRKVANTRRVGHAGTLDPFATGLLIIGINKGTKALTGLVGLDKTYEAVARLGATSTTEDPEGTITETLDPVTGRGGVTPPLREEIEEVLEKFRGGYLQTASAFSAKKVGGKKLYDLARAGKMEGVEIPKKQIVITELEITDYAWPNLSFRVSCSSGTYIRSLARDIGEALKCGAYLTDLRRTRIGDFSINDAIRVDELTPETLQNRLRVV